MGNENPLTDVNAILHQASIPVVLAQLLLGKKIDSRRKSKPHREKMNLTGPNRKDVHTSIRLGLHSHIVFIWGLH